MYQIAFPAELLASFVPWLMLNRDDLTILLHPETGNDYADHTDHAVWFGAILPLRGCHVTFFHHDSGRPPNRLLHR
jgi:aromatic ring-cleaving dioxygenase